MLTYTEAISGFVGSLHHRTMVYTVLSVHHCHPLRAPREPLVGLSYLYHQGHGRICVWTRISITLGRIEIIAEESLEVQFIKELEAKKEHFLFGAVPTFFFSQ